MNCDFIKDLSAEQRNQLRKLLDETPSTPQYRVEVEFWDKEKTQIRYLLEYLGDQLHGVSKGWDKSGQLRHEDHYQDDRAHGVWKRWSPDGQLQLEEHYQNGERVK